MEFRGDSLTETIIQCIIEVHRELGPGFLESVYRKALVIELQRNNLNVEEEKEIRIYYKEALVGTHRLDIVIENLVIIELKTVESLSKAHYAQIKSYLKASGCKIGLLVNLLNDKADFRRIEMPE